MMIAIDDDPMYEEAVRVVARDGRRYKPSSGAAPWDTIERLESLTKWKRMDWLVKRARNLERSTRT